MQLENLEEYTHPALYDLENQDFEPEGNWTNFAF